MSNRKRRCLCCKSYGIAEDGIISPRGWFINEDHALAYAKQNMAKAVKVQKREKVKADRVFKQKKKVFKQNDLRRQHELTQAVANQLCNLLDAFKPCISCGRGYEGARKRNASHFKSRGANSFLRYDLRNLHSACVVCNLHLSGNIEGYKAGLCAAYGQWIIDYLESAPRSKDWTAQELIELRRSYSAEIRHIRAGNPPTRNWRSLEND